MLTLVATGAVPGGASASRFAREDDLSFLRRRAQEEADRARAATGPDAAKAHLRLAAAYLARIAKAERPGLLAPVSTDEDPSMNTAGGRK